jgi:hypothetical protein
LRYKIRGAPKKNGHVPYLGLELNHACPQKPNPSRETVPINKNRKDDGIVEERII